MYAPTFKAIEEEIEQFYQQLQEVISEILRRNVLLIIGDFNPKVRDNFVRSMKGKIWHGNQKWKGESLTETFIENLLFVFNTLFQQPIDRTRPWTFPDSTHQNKIEIFLGHKNGKAPWKSQNQYQLQLLDWPCSLKSHYQFQVKVI